MKSDLRLAFLGILLCFSLVPTEERTISGGDILFNFDPDIKRNVTELISSKGYPVEDHVVQTKDGFLLSMQHIPHGITKQQKPNSEVVILQHGLLSAGSDFVLNFPHQSLGFILADAGYDVWIGNTRGNTYSKRHVKYTPDMKEFWDYSFDQMAEFDLPAMIDYVLNRTQQKQLSYIGHSQGTTSAFALLSEKLEYNEKVKRFIALAPVAHAGGITSFLKYLAPFAYDLDFIAEMLGVYQFLPSDALLNFLSEVVCETEIRYLCKDMIFLLFGADPQQLNSTRIGVYTAHFPAGSSTKSIIHYAQLVNSKTFRKYDYGRKENLRRYNQTTPPLYDVSRITTPVALLWSLDDNLADPSDVSILREKLKSLVSSYCIPDPLFNHMDFIIAIEANKLVYDQVLALLREMS